MTLNFFSFNLVVKIMAANMNYMISISMDIHSILGVGKCGTFPLCVNPLGNSGHVSAVTFPENREVYCRNV